jgi:hypothetical protein
VRELQDLIRLFLRDWDVRFGPKADFSSGFPAQRAASSRHYRFQNDLMPPDRISGGQSDGRGIYAERASKFDLGKE